MGNRIAGYESLVTGGEKIPEEKTERHEPKFIQVENAEVKIPQVGESFSAIVTKLGMTTSGEYYGEKAKGTGQEEVLLIFFENKQEGIKEAHTPVNFYKIPNPKSAIASFVRKYGQPKAGQTVKVFRNEKGYWEIDL